MMKFCGILSEYDRIEGSKIQRLASVSVNTAPSANCGERTNKTRAAGQAAKMNLYNHWLLLFVIFDSTVNLYFFYTQAQGKDRGLERCQLHSLRHFVALCLQAVLPLLQQRELGMVLV